MGIDVKIESPYGPDGETLHDPRDWLGLLLAVADRKDTKCLQFIDPYGDTLFNQVQLPVLIDELKAAVAVVSAERLRSYKQWVARTAREVGWQATIIQHDENAANASEFEFHKEASNVRAHITKVLRVLEDGVKAGPHNYVRFMGD